MRFSIFLIWMVWAPVCLAAENCYRHWTELQGQTYSCDPYTATGFPAVLGSTEVRMYHYSEGWTGESGQVELLRAVSEGARESINYLSQLGPIPAIYFLLLNEVTDFAWADATWQGPASHQPCLVRLYLNIPNDVAEAKQAVAHELFHCQQAKAIQFPTSAQPLGSFFSSSWWVEGSATYFSNLVYPNANGEWDPAQRYDPSSDLFHQAFPYSTVSFFQYLENRGLSPLEVMHFLKKQPALSTFDGERAALSKVPEIDSIWHDYTTNFVQQSIKDTGGQVYPLPVIPLQAPVLISAQTPAIDVSIRSFSMKHFPSRFESGSTTEVLLPSDSKVKVSFRREGQKEYKLLLPGNPVVFEVACKGEAGELIEWLFTSTVDSSAPTETTIALKPGPQKECLCKDLGQPLDACLVGHWKVDNAAVEASFRKKYGDRLKEFHALGLEEWVVAPNKTGKLNYQQREIGLKVQWTPIQDKTLRTIHNGFSDMRLLMQKPGEICMRHTHQEGTVVSWLDSTSTSMTMSEYLNPPQGYPEPHYKFACQGRKLHLWYEAGGVEVMGWHFTK